MAANGSATPTRSGEALPASEAMAFLEQYARGDGLSLSELMDSRQHGGLTYNDFLMLPGHINFPVSQLVARHIFASQSPPPTRGPC